MPHAQWPNPTSATASARYLYKKALSFNAPGSINTVATSK